MRGPSNDRARHRRPCAPRACRREPSRRRRRRALQVSACLDVARVLGYVDDAAVADALALADRIRAMTYRLSLKPR